MLRSHALLLFSLTLLAACGGSDPSGPSTGSLTVAVTGLPSGTSADITVVGPNGYTHALAGSETLSGLAPGGYTVSAQIVSAGAQAYQPAQNTQSVTVSDGGTPASAQVVYGLVESSLTITIAGLPPGADAAVTVSGPDGFEQSLSATTTFSGVSAGVYTIAAQSVAPAGVQYNPSPSTQNVNLTVDGSATAGVSYSQAPSGGFNLRIDGMYLTQSVQTYGGSVPLVKDRDGFLRVFVTATESNLAAPSVRVRFYLGGALASESTIAAPGLSVPLSPNEGSLTSSWNLPVPKALIQPSLSVVAEVDPGNAVGEADETDNAFPTTGTPLPLDVRTTSTFNVRMVPIVQSANGRSGNVTNANKDGFLAATMRLHPLASFSADLRAPYTTNAPAVDKDNANNAWTTILGQLDALRAADGSSRFYFGVLNPAYSSGVAGIGYVGGKSALGWDKNGADAVAAHEWGHNWGRRHAPCGTAGNPDPDFPYAGGVIGVYGLDVQAQSLKPPTSADLMGYCGSEWISDYTYEGVLNYRGVQSDVASAGFEQAMQPCLLVWGRIVDGQPVLEPAFQLVTRPSLPAGPGDYHVEGRAADGSRLFRLSFTPEEVADDPQGNRHFAFAVPLQPDRAERLEALSLRVPGRPELAVRAAAASADPSAVAAEVRSWRVPSGVAVSWDAAAHPMVMVRDPATGQVLSFASGGHAEIATDRDDLDVQLSNRLVGRSVRVKVPVR
ncbi:MAG TPA: hypothetical protein VMY76_05815 [Gemmatimonadales bacterium]|nr:hypothetical protein [Gemmatimonadales bacterium]